MEDNKQYIAEYTSYKTVYAKTETEALGLIDSVEISKSIFRKISLAETSQKTKKEILYEMLEKLGFELTSNDSFLFYKKDKCTLIYPNSSELQDFHYNSTKEYLYMNNIMGINDFNNLFK